MAASFGSAATVTFITSPPVWSKASSCAAYSGTPCWCLLAAGVEFSRGSAARVTMNPTPINV
ncbi:hypothetical protein H7J74_06260 [Mycobacterium angelicum]|nr:hypothetical protein [Mycobacterium angelicum]